MVKAKFSSTEVRKIAWEFAAILETNRIKVGRLILYGSYARGNPRDFSDIDLAVISPDFRGKNRLQIQEMIAAAVSGRKGAMVVVEPIGYNPEEYARAKRETFLGEIKQTGKRITLDGRVSKNRQGNRGRYGGLGKRVGEYANSLT